MKNTVTTKIIASLLLLAPLGVSAAGDQSPPATGEARESSGQYTDDASITTEVKAALIKDGDIQASKISVTTVQGVVKLTGVVASNQQKREAESLARHVARVKDVLNNLRVR